MSNFLICGMPGSGKSTLAKKLAIQLERECIDTDQLIEERYQKSCRDIYLEKGESYFREIEKQVLSSLSHKENAIIALGGGTLDLIENQQLIKKMGTLIYLECDPKILKRRKMPSYISSEEAFQDLLDKRIPIFESLNDYTILSEAEYGK